MARPTSMLVSTTSYVITQFMLSRFFSRFSPLGFFLLSNVPGLRSILPTPGFTSHSFNSRSVLPCHFRSILPYSRGLPPHHTRSILPHQRGIPPPYRGMPPSSPLTLDRIRSRLIRSSPHVPAIFHHLLYGLITGPNSCSAILTAGLSTISSG